MIKDVIFIGNRKNVLIKLLEMKDRYRVSKVFALKNSYLHSYLKDTNFEYTLFEINSADKKHIIKTIIEANWDILISNGCPFILPISFFKQKHPDNIFINTHPTYLPHLKGATPLNGVFYLNYDFIGATTHFMNDEIDNGNIIFQTKVALTKDIDQGLIYFISFHLEGQVFESAMKKLELHNFNYLGVPQNDEGTYFNRESKLFNIEWGKDTNETILRKVKSVGIDTQGLSLNLMEGNFVVFEASEIVNPYLLEIFSSKEPGEILHKYSNKIIVKTSEGAINFSYVK